MASRGEAAQYFNGGSQQQPSGYQMNGPPQGGQWQQQQQQQPQQGYGYGAPQQGGYGPPPGPPPPQQHYNNGGAPPMPPPPTYGQQYGSDHKPAFEETFKIEKPKWNDLWAGALFLAVCAGFVAVSGIAIQGYASTKSFNGGGIYGSQNDFGLSTNTIVLFAFCLGVAFVLGYGYVWIARSKINSSFIREDCTLTT